MSRVQALRQLIELLPIEPVPADERLELADLVLSGAELSDAERLLVASILVAPGRRPPDPGRAEARRELAEWSLIIQRLVYGGSAESAVNNTAKRYEVSERKVWGARAELAADAEKSKAAEELIEALSAIGTSAAPF
jgi:hypothetical protein